MIRGMRVLVLSDVHANLIALDEVLADAAAFYWLDRRGYDTIWSLGDIVGYGPCPNECVQRLLSLAPDHVRVAGNHDWAALDRLDIDDFNPEARSMVRWTRAVLEEASLAYLRELASTPLVDGKFTITHASPRHPIWEYISSTHIARENFDFFDTPFCFVGHTHVPVVFRLAFDAQKRRMGCTGHRAIFDRDISLAGEHRLIVNPGSVGQPRDNDPRAAYAQLDTGEELIRFRRVRYDVEMTQAAMRAANLPDRLIARLAYGW
jgi:diadenosine tetraphosphatase ApaH/serine/threonine PP2A family protein phosphatase